MSTTYTLGKLLAETRETRGLAVEDIAHATRIPVATVRCLENDDYSQFPNLVYARSFLKLYSHHLDVDASEFLGELKDLSGSDRNKGGYFSGQFNRKEIEEIKDWKKHIPVRPILTGLFFVAIGVPAAWWVSKLYLDYQKEQGETIVESSVVPDDPKPEPEPVVKSSAENGVPASGDIDGTATGKGTGALVNRPPAPPPDILNAPRAGAVVPEEEKPEPEGDNPDGNEAPAEATTGNSPETAPDGSPVASASLLR